MVNRFRRFTSHGFGIASAALIVAATSVHQQGPVAGMQGGRATHAVAEVAPVQAGSLVVTKVDFELDPSVRHGAGG